MLPGCTWCVTRCIVMVRGVSEKGLELLAAPERQLQRVAGKVADHLDRLVHPAARPTRPRLAVHGQHDVAGLDARSTEGIVKMRSTPALPSLSAAGAARALVDALTALGQLEHFLLGCSRRCKGRRRFPACRAPRPAPGRRRPGLVVVVSGSRAPRPAAVALDSSRIPARTPPRCRPTAP